MHLDLSGGDLDFRQSPDGHRPTIRLANLNKNLQHLSLEDIAVNTDGLSFEGNFGFPALKYLNFYPSDQGVPGSNTAAFRYFCTNSSKLEEIHFDGNYSNDNQCYDKSTRNQVSLRTIVSSIGPLDKRPSLRTLSLLNWDHTFEPQTTVLRLFNSFYNLEKINLENVALRAAQLPFAELLRFVDGNLKLKRLELGMNDLDSQSMWDLIHIMDCKSGIEELDLGFCAWRFAIHREVWPLGGLGDPDGLIHRSQFPKFIKQLKKHAEF